MTSQESIRVVPHLPTQRVEGRWLRWGDLGRLVGKRSLKDFLTDLGFTLSHPVLKQPLVPTESKLPLMKTRQSLL